MITNKVPDELFKNPEKHIPFGMYCYTPIKIITCSDDNMPTFHIKTCPFWDYDPEKDGQECGYCHLMKQGDWEIESLSLLWDQVKECGINEDFGDLDE